MEIRAEPLPEAVEAFLDGAAEDGDITALGDLACRLYGDVNTMARIVRGPAPIDLSDEQLADFILQGHASPRPGYRQRRQIALQLEEHALDIAAQLTTPRRVALVLRGVQSIRAGCVQTAEYLARFNYEDATKGGAAEPWRRYPRMDRQMLPTPRARRHLYSPRAIRRYVAHAEELPHQRTLFQGLISLDLPTDIDQDTRHHETLFGDLQAQQAAQRRRRSEENWRQFMLGHAPGARHLHDRRGRRQLLRITKRAAGFVAALLGREAVSAFARGEPVLLRGQDVTLAVTLRGSIHSKGHGAIRVTLQDHDGKELAGLCVYQDVPALDQLAGLALHVQAGTEDEILDVGNLYAIRDLSAPIIRIIRGRRGLDPMPDQDEAIPVVRHPEARVSARRGRVWRTDRELFAVAQERYWLETGALYRQAAATQVFGRAHRILQIAEGR